MQATMSTAVIMIHNHATIRQMKTGRSTICLSFLISLTSRDMIVNYYASVTLECYWRKCVLWDHGIR